MDLNLKYLKLAILASALPLAACGSGDNETADRSANDSQIPADMQVEIADSAKTLGNNIGNSDDEILQAGLPYRLPIVPDGKVINNRRGGKHMVFETSFSPTLAATFYEQAGKEGGFTTQRAEGSGGTTVSGTDGKRKWRMSASKNGSKTKISIHQTGE